MSAFYSRMRDLSARLFARFGVAASVSRAGTMTRDKIKGTVTPGAPTVSTCRGMLGSRKLVADDGTVTMQSIATLNAPAKAGDTITIGSVTMTVSDVEQVAPDGGQPLKWIAVLK